jgi:hypothetical protein
LPGAGVGNGSALEAGVETCIKLDVEEDMGVRGVSGGEKSNRPLSRPSPGKDGPFRLR